MQWELQLVSGVFLITPRNEKVSMKLLASLRNKYFSFFGIIAHFSPPASRLALCLARRARRLALCLARLARRCAHAQAGAAALLVAAGAVLPRARLAVLPGAQALAAAADAAGAVFNCAHGERRRRRAQPLETLHGPPRRFAVHAERQRPRARLRVRACVRAHRAD